MNELFVLVSSVFIANPYFYRQKTVAKSFISAINIYLCTLFF